MVASVCTVPLQNNSYDCGVFVCRYAYAIYELRHRNFTYGDAGMYCEEGETNLGDSRRAFRTLISDGAEFDFDMKDIARFREEFKTLIERLSVVYMKWKNASNSKVQSNQEPTTSKLEPRIQAEENMSKSAGLSDGIVDALSTEASGEETKLSESTLPSKYFFGASEGKENMATEMDLDKKENGEKAYQGPEASFLQGRSTKTEASSNSQSLGSMDEDSETLTAMV